MKSKEVGTEISAQMKQKTLFVRPKNSKAHDFSCNSDHFVKGEKVPDSRELKVVFDFIEEIRNLTKKLWVNLGINDEIKNLLREKNNCFSIVDTKNGEALNSNTVHINFWLLEYERVLLKHPGLHDSLFYVISAFESLENFLFPTLSLFEKNITDIKIHMRIYDAGYFISEINEFKNVGNYVNEVFQEYLEQLHHIITQFESKNAINEVEEIKETEKFNKMNQTEETKESEVSSVKGQIEEIKKVKVLNAGEYHGEITESRQINTISQVDKIKQKILSQIENSLQYIGDLIKINKIEQTLITEKTSDVNIQTEPKNNITENTSSETKLIPDANLTGIIASQKAISEENADAKSTDEATEKQNLQEQTIVSYFNESFTVKNNSYYHNTTSHHGESMNVIASNSSNVIIFICLPILLSVIIGSIITYCV